MRYTKAPAGSNEGTVEPGLVVGAQIRGEDLEVIGASRQQTGGGVKQGRNAVVLGLEHQGADKTEEVVTGQCGHTLIAVGVQVSDVVAGEDDVVPRGAGLVIPHALLTGKMWHC